MTKQTKAEVVAEIKSQIDSLQVWFASRPYGFREKCSDEQRQQFEDREREQEYLIGRLEMLEGQDEGRWVMTALGRKWLTKEAEERLRKGQVKQVLDYEEIEG